jgi:hypothetical protein
MRKKPTKSLKPKKKEAPAKKATPVPCKKCAACDAAPDPRAPLENPKWEKFCRNIALLNMATMMAYLDAFDGKNKSYASGKGGTLRKKIEIQNRIIQLSERAIEQDLITREWIYTQLKEVAERCMQKVPVIVNGIKTGEWKFDARGANTALQLMGKDLGMFVDKLQIVKDELYGKTDAEVREMVEANFNDLGRPVCIQMMEKVFGLKYEGDGKDLDGGKTPTVESVPTLQ